MSGDGFGQLTVERDCASVLVVNNPASFLGILMHSSALLFGKRNRGREGSSALDPGENQQDSPPETGKMRCGENGGGEAGWPAEMHHHKLLLVLIIKKLITKWKGINQRVYTSGMKFEKNMKPHKFMIYDIKFSSREGVKKWGEANKPWLHTKSNAAWSLGQGLSIFSGEGVLRMGSYIYIAWRDCEYPPPPCLPPTKIAVLSGDTQVGVRHTHKIKIRRHRQNHGARKGGSFTREGVDTGLGREGGSDSAVVWAPPEGHGVDGKVVGRAECEAGPWAAGETGNGSNLPQGSELGPR